MLKHEAAGPRTGWLGDNSRTCAILPFRAVPSSTLHKAAPPRAALFFGRMKTGESNSYKNSTPSRLVARQATRHFRFTNSGLTRRVNSSGMAAGRLTSRAAPVPDMLRMMQSMGAATPKMMEPPLNVRRRGLRRFSDMLKNQFGALRPDEPHRARKPGYASKKLRGARRR